MQTPYHITIIGTGPAGTFLGLQLMRQASKRGIPLSIDFLDEGGEFGPGRPFSLSQPNHFRMSAISTASDVSAYHNEQFHFFKWICLNWDRLSKHYPQLVEGTSPTPDMIVRRAVYGLYLSETLDHAIHEAAFHGITARRIICAALNIVPPEKIGEMAQVVPIGGAFQVTQTNFWGITQDVLPMTDALHTDLAVIATGLGRIEPPLYLASYMDENGDSTHPRVLSKIWASCGASTTACDPVNVVTQSLEGKHTVVVTNGTNLSACDFGHLLHGGGFEGTLIMISPSGLLPYTQGNRQTYQLRHLTVERLRQGGITPEELTRLFYKECHDAMLLGHAEPFNDVMDAIRCKRNTLYVAMDDTGRANLEGGRFAEDFTIDNLFSFRDFINSSVRITQETSASLQALHEQGRLVVLQGRIRALQETEDGLSVIYEAFDHKELQEDGTVKDVYRLETLPAHYFAEVSGPSPDISRMKTGLVKNLWDQGVISQSPYNRGIQTDPTGYAINGSGTVHNHLLVSGDLMGHAHSWGKSGILPNIRESTYEQAERILDRIVEITLSPHQIPEASSSPSCGRSAGL